MQKKTPIQRIHKRKNRFFKIIIFIAILSMFILFILNSPLFNIGQVKISNNKYLKKEDILNQSKIRKGTNIFKLKIDNAEKEIEKNPFIKSADIKRKLPNIIEIEIIEREKTFLFQYISTYMLIDKEGFIMDHLETKNKKFPVIKGFNTDFTQVSQNIFENKENENLKTFIDEAKNLKILSQIDEVNKDFANDVDIKLKSGISVAFGTLNNVKYKLSLLKEILEDIEKKEIKKGKIIMNKGKHPILIIDE